VNGQPTTMTKTTITTDFRQPLDIHSPLTTQIAFYNDITVNDLP
jgi:hypothetical protein